MAPVLSTSARAAGHGLTHWAETGSTNAEALARTDGHGSSPHWFVADRQTAGRGRRGRAWTSEPGNLFCSLLLTNPAPPAKVAELCFVAALAVDDAVLTLAPQLAERLALKWPNDLIVDGAKVAGILIEATTQGAASHVAVGIGVNVAHAPTDTAYGATSMAALGAHVSRDELFEALTGSMTRALAVWRAGEGFAAIRAGWLARAAGLGGPLIARTETEAREGVFAGLDAAGRLILDTPDGRAFIAAGEIFFHSDAKAV